jgi:hypothetical protein
VGRQVLSAPRSLWQRAYVERVIGTIRRECLDHMIVFGETSFGRNLHLYFDYYHESRTHLSLSKGAPHRAGMGQRGTGSQPQGTTPTKTKCFSIP